MSDNWKETVCHGSWICVLILCLSMCVDRSWCLSALPSDRAPDEVIRTVTGVARLHCLYLAGVSVVRCQIVITLVVSLRSVSVFQVLRLFSPDRVSVFPWRVRTGLYSPPELETPHCRCSDTLCYLSEWATHAQCACAVPYYSWKPSIWRPAHKFELPCLSCERVRK